jgi:hypothetical protein
LRMAGEERLGVWDFGWPAGRRACRSPKARCRVPKKEAFSLALKDLTLVRNERLRGLGPPRQTQPDGCAVCPVRWEGSLPPKASWESGSRKGMREQHIPSGRRSRGSQAHPFRALGPRPALSSSQQCSPFPGPSLAGDGAGCGHLFEVQAFEAPDRRVSGERKAVLGASGEQSHKEWGMAEVEIELPQAAVSHPERVSALGAPRLTGAEDLAAISPLRPLRGSSAGPAARGA